MKAGTETRCIVSSRDVFNVSKKVGHTNGYMTMGWTYHQIAHFTQYPYKMTWYVFSPVLLLYIIIKDVFTTLLKKY